MIKQLFDLGRGRTNELNARDIVELDCYLSGKAQGKADITAQYGLIEGMAGCPVNHNERNSTAWLMGYARGKMFTD